MLKIFRLNGLRKFRKRFSFLREIIRAIFSGATLQHFQNFKRRRIKPFRRLKHLLTCFLKNNLAREEVIHRLRLNFFLHRFLLAGFFLEEINRCKFFHSLSRKNRIRESHLESCFALNLATRENHIEGRWKSHLLRQTIRSAETWKNSEHHFRKPECRFQIVRNKNLFTC